MSSLATRVEPYQGFWADDTALNAVRMHCSDAAGQQTTAQPIESDPGIRGDWSGFERCPSGQHVVAIKVAVEPYQGIGDDIAADGVMALCSDGATELYNNNSLGFGGWSDWVRCPAGSAVCGFRIKIEQALAVDKTAMNDMQADCCSLQQTQAVSRIS